MVGIIHTAVQAPIRVPGCGPLCPLGSTPLYKSCQYGVYVAVALSLGLAIAASLSPELETLCHAYSKLAWYVKRFLAGTILRYAGFFEGLPVAKTSAGDVKASLTETNG
jgi:hypothetical protein